MYSYMEKGANVPGNAIQQTVTLHLKVWFSEKRTYKSHPPNSKMSVGHLLLELGFDPKSTAGLRIPRPYY